jgi:hypothetical protein
MFRMIDAVADRGSSASSRPSAADAVRAALVAESCRTFPMNRDDDDFIAIARCMIEHYGKSASGLMEEHARQHQDVNEFEDAEFWNRVAKTIRRLQNLN